MQGLSAAGGAVYRLAANTFFLASLADVAMAVIEGLAAMHDAPWVEVSRDDGKPWRVGVVNSAKMIEGRGPTLPDALLDALEGMVAK